MRKKGDGIVVSRTGVKNGIGYAFPTRKKEVVSYSVTEEASTKGRYPCIEGGKRRGGEVDKPRSHPIPEKKREKSNSTARTQLANHSGGNCGPKFAAIKRSNHLPLWKKLQGRIKIRPVYIGGGKKLHIPFILTKRAGQYYLGAHYETGDR